MTSSTIIIPEEATPGLQPSPFIPETQKPDPFSLVIFGATGDLAARKLLPALYGLWHDRFLPAQFDVVGIGRRAKDDNGFRNDVRAAIAESRRHSSQDVDDCDAFLSHVFYQRADFTTTEAMRRSTAG